RAAPPDGRASRPPIGRGNEARRLEWARKHQHLTADDWKKVLFADEATFEVDGDPTVTHGGGGGGNSVRVWGCFSHSGVGHLHRVDRALTEESYLSGCSGPIYI
uniref:Transposase Tc1-like domain-containing protein n=1 Tax=Scophthalmus maximus TaxID=52904 RepID=A0A8D3CXM1_SCOMX